MRWIGLLVIVAACGRIDFGGAGDAAVIPADVASDAAPSSCAGFDLCDRFESPTLASVWLTASSGVSLDTTHAHSGSQAVHLHTPQFGVGQTVYVQLGESQTLASPPTQFWVRVWYWMSAAPAAGNHVELISVEPMAGGNGDYLFGYPAAEALYSQFSQAVQMTPPLGAPGGWWCAVFSVTRATSATGTLAVANDNVSPVTMTQVQTDSLATPIEVIWMGLGFAGGNVTADQPALDVWIDDVIVHHAPVTCSD